MSEVVDGEDCCTCSKGHSILHDQGSLPDLGASKKPMLPFEALHRIASPFARANAPSSDLGGFASAPETVSPTVTPTVTHRPRRRNNSSVSFFCDAEWFYIDEEDPFGPPVLKRLRLKPEDCDQGDGNSQSSYNSDAHFDDNVGVATSTPLLLNLAVPGACPDEEAIATSKPSLVLPLPIERHLDENRDGDMTPKAKDNPSVCLGFGFKRGGDFDDDIANSGLQAKTPKAHSSTPAFGMFSESADSEDNSDNEDRDPETMQVCNGDATPSAKNNASSGFGFGFGGEDDDQESVTSDQMEEGSSDSDSRKVDVDPMTPKSSALTLQFGKCSLEMGSFDTISTAASDSSPTTGLGGAIS